MMVHVAHRDNPDKTGLLNKLTGKDCELILVTMVREKEKEFFGYTVTEEGVVSNWYSMEGWELYSMGGHDIQRFLRLSRTDTPKLSSLIRKKYTTADLINDALKLNLFIVNNHTVVKYAKSVQ